MSDKDDLENEGEEEESPPPQYEEIVQEEPEREVNLEQYEVPKTMSEEEEESVARTDFQTAVRVLLPKFPNKRLNDLLRPAMVSRIFPDNYTDKHFLLTASLIEESNPEDDVDVVGIISMVQDALSIGFRGEGRVDIAEAMGAAREAEMEKLSKDLGI